MIDPVGSIGAPPAESDIAIAAGGGPKYQERLRKLSAEADRLEQAAAQLRLGEDIQRKLSQAEGRLNDANRKQKQAEEVLADARTRAESIIHDANQQAANRVDEAQKAFQRIAQEGAVVRKAAEDYSKQVRADADAASHGIDDRINATREAEERAKAAEAYQVGVGAQHAQWAARAEQKTKELQGKIDRLNAVLREIA